MPSASISFAQLGEMRPGDGSASGLSPVIASTCEAVGLAR